MVFGLITGLFGQVSAAAKSKQINSRGWGDQYRWKTLEEGMALAAKHQKPLMVIVHSMNCSSCINLKRQFAKADSLLEMSEKFIMVNLDSSEVPKDNSFAPDGFYVPRVLFFTPSGYLMRDVSNEYRTDYRFMYSHPAFMVDSMKTAVNKVKKL